VIYSINIVFCSGKSYFWRNVYCWHQP